MEAGPNKERGDERMEDFMSTNQTIRPFFFFKLKKHQPV